MNNPQDKVRIANRRKLNTSTLNVLKAAGIREGYYGEYGTFDIGKLMRVTDEELLRCRGCGPKILERIHTIRDGIRKALE